MQNLEAEWKTYGVARCEAGNALVVWAESTRRLVANDFSVKSGKMSASQAAAVTVALRAAADVLTAYGLQGIVKVDLGDDQGTHEIDNF